MIKKAYLIIIVVAIVGVSLGVFLGSYVASKAWPIFRERLTEDEVQALVVADLVDIGVMQYPLVVDFTITYIGDWIWSGTCIEQWGSNQPIHGWVFYEKTHTTQLTSSTKFDW